MTDTTTMESTKMTYIRNEQGHYVCPECDVVKVKQNTMHYHMTKCRLKNKPVEERPTHTCEFCVASLPFLTAEALSLHLARMAGRSGHPEMDHIKDVECPFEDCDFHDINKGNVRMHCMRKHMAKEVKDLLERDDNQISCTNCKVVFKSLGSFYYHSIGCITLPETDERHQLLAQLT
jgi:hypothetical protein